MLQGLVVSLCWKIPLLLLLCVCVCSCTHACVFRKQAVWEFHFSEVTFIGCCVYTYTWLVPCCLWGFLWWRGNRSQYTLLQLLAIYGYSVSIFIPLVVSWNLIAFSEYTFFLILHLIPIKFFISVDFVANQK